MLSKPESTVSFENFPINPGILELWMWVDKNSSSFIKFLGGRVMNDKPKQLNFHLWNFNCCHDQLKTTLKKAVAEGLNKGEEYKVPWTGSIWVNACVFLPGSYK